MNYSVVIPTYDREVLLRRAVESVFKQTLPPSQVIVIEDGQQTLTAERLCGTDERLDFASSGVRKGAPSARNIGLSHAREDFVAFLDDDDEWRPTKMEKQLDWLRKNPAAVGVVCGYEYRKGGVSHIRVPSENTCNRYRFYENLFGSFSALVVRKQVGPLPLLDEALPSCQDWDYFLRLLTLGRIGVFGEPLVIYHAHEGVRISTQVDKKLEGLRRIAEKYDAIVPYGARKWMHARIALCEAISASKLTARVLKLLQGLVAMAQSDFPIRGRLVTATKAICEILFGLELTEKLWALRLKKLHSK